MEDPQEMVGEDHKVEEKNRDDANSHKEVVLAYAKNKKSQRGYDIFDDEEVDISIINEEVHEGIDFLGSSFNKEDRKVGIENTEQYNEEKSDEETVAVAVSIQISFPIRPPSNRLAVSREHVSAKGFRWPLAPILDGSSVDFLSFHFSMSENSKPWKTVQVPLVLSHPPRKYGPETDVLKYVDAFLLLSNQITDYQNNPQQGT
jgi:hypothetical protein